MSGNHKKHAKEASKDPFCSNIFSVDAKFHKRVRCYVKKTLKEHGGDTVIDFDHNKVLPATMQVGKYDRVDLNRGLVDWHTHPAGCLNRDTCTIGLPSPADMANVAIGVASGTLAHMVYSREGTYVIQMKYQVRSRLLTDPTYRTAKAKRSSKVFSELYHSMGEESHETYRAKTKKVSYL